MPKMTVEEAFAKVADLGISWVQEQWIDDVREPTAACVMGALAIACTGGDFSAGRDDRRATELLLCEDPEFFRSQWGDFVDDMVDYRTRCVWHAEHEGNWPTTLDIPYVEVPTLADLGSGEDRERFEQMLLEAFSYADDVEDTSLVVKNAIGQEAFDSLSFMPTFNDGDLFEHLGQLYADNHGPDGCVFDYGVFYDGPDPGERMEVRPTEDQDLYNDFFAHRQSPAVWGDIVTVLRHEYPSVLGLEICTDENCKDC